MIADILLEVLLVFIGILTIVLIYARISGRYKAPDGAGFNDIMSHYIWRSRKEKRSMLLNDEKQVKQEKINKSLARIDGKLTDAMHAVKDKVRPKFDKPDPATKKCSDMRKDLDKLKIELDTIQATKKSTSVVKMPSARKQKLISQMKEVYHNG